ncbi:hypothetical protein ATANTOWER_016385, partial [Ataeniobius toweri]|nr:hypothetical protein [Ataeniobius toweri]
MSALEVLEEITRLSDTDIEDSSDTTVDFDEEEDEQLLLIDPIHDNSIGCLSFTTQTSTQEFWEQLRHRADRSAELSGKRRGGRICFYINE